MEKLTSGKKITVMVAIMSALLFSSLNQTIIGAAMPRIIAKLGGMDYYSWVFTVYMLTSSIPGLGLGTTMPIFILAVQNALPRNLLGVTTSSTQLFRSLGGTVGVSIMGTIMASKLKAELPKHLPPQLQKLEAGGSAMSGLSNPQALLDPATISSIRNSLPTQATWLFDQALLALKQSLTISLEHLFVWIIDYGVGAVNNFTAARNTA